jgi:type III restriction enzyme
MNQVSQPILVSPYQEPDKHWYIQRGETPRIVEDRRPSFVFKPQGGQQEWDTTDGSLGRLKDYENAYEMRLVNRLREAVGKWRDEGYPGVTRTTLELLDLWRSEDRSQRLFFAQIEAAETVIFLREARQDYLQGIDIPHDELASEFASAEFKPWLRYACKMATGSGKTTVMAMLASWSIINKVNNRSDGRFSDAVLVVCPNVTIRDRLRELDPQSSEASLYRTRNLVPSHMMPLLARGRVLVTNWHVFEAQEMGRVGDTGSRVVKKGVIEERDEIIHIGDKNTTARGKRYLTLSDYEKQIAAQIFFVKSETRDESGNLKSAAVYFRRYVESDSALVERVLGRDLGKKQNILVLNDEAHHAYRIHPGSPESDEESLTGTAEEDDSLMVESTVWVEGLDKIHVSRGINFAIDLSATPYFLARAGRDTGRPFPWTVSDFGLVDAIESGLVKVPQLPARDAAAKETAQYFNVWEWVMSKLSRAEKRESGAGPKPDAVLKHAAVPISIMAGEWRSEFLRWQEREDKRPPVFIIVCKEIKLAKAVHEWIAEGVHNAQLPPFAIHELRNEDGRLNTIRVDTQVVTDTEGAGAKSDRARWMRFTLDTVGRLDWPRDSQGRSIYPEGFEELATKLGESVHPPGRDVRCIVSVGMLTEGWDATTVTHIIGLRPFMSQLLCEQVVGRGLRRASYEPNENGLFNEELAQVFGVPFEIVPFKGSDGPQPPPPKRFRVRALPERRDLEIRFPRVEGYTQVIKSRVTVNWNKMPTLKLDPDSYPTDIDVEGLIYDNTGKLRAGLPGTLKEVTINPYFAGMRLQRGVFQLASALTKLLLSADKLDRLADKSPSISPHMLFPQIKAICERFVEEYVDVPPGSERVHVFQAPYYTRALGILLEQIQPDTQAGESPELPLVPELHPEGSSEDVDFWTSRDVSETIKSHVNYVVADSGWEAKARHRMDRHRSVIAYVKNAGLNFTIPYIHDGQMRDFYPDFIVKVNDGNSANPLNLVLETKGYDELLEVKESAAVRWVNAVNADGRFGRWQFRMARKVEDVISILDDAATSSAKGADLQYPETNV